MIPMSMFLLKMLLIATIDPTYSSRLKFPRSDTLTEKKNVLNDKKNVLNEKKDVLNEKKDVLNEKKDASNKMDQSQLIDKLGLQTNPFNEQQSHNPNNSHSSSPPIHPYIFLLTITRPPRYPLKFIQTLMFLIEQQHLIQCVKVQVMDCPRDDCQEGQYQYWEGDAQAKHNGRKKRDKDQNESIMDSHSNRNNRDTINHSKHPNPTNTSKTYCYPSSHPMSPLNYLTVSIDSRSNKRLAFIDKPTSAMQVIEDDLLMRGTYKIHQEGGYDRLEEWQQFEIDEGFRRTIKNHKKTIWAQRYQ